MHLISICLKDTFFRLVQKCHSSPRILSVHSSRKSVIVLHCWSFDRLKHLSWECWELNEDYENFVSPCTGACWHTSRTQTPSPPVPPDCNCFKVRPGVIIRHVKRTLRLPDGRVAVGESDDVHDGSAGHGGGDLAQQPRYLLALGVAVMLVEKHTSSGQTFTEIYTFFNDLPTNLLKQMISLLYES